jgi:hypothetical protein
LREYSSSKNEFVLLEQSNAVAFVSHRVDLDGWRLPLRLQQRNER